VTCSHDRAAFVWERSGETWSPQVVVLQHQRGALDVKWAPDGRKFAVASGSKKAMVCFFDASNNWWVSKDLRKHKSTVLTCAWHPSGRVLATVSTD
jgi:actin related protein 2/3 complex, subunit 1A/1B